MRRHLSYDPGRDYYTLLGVTPEATPDAIRQAYRQCVREVHPDLNPDRQAWATAQLQRINEAYDVLSDPLLRREYDRLRWPHVPNRPRATATATATSAPPFRRAPYDTQRPWWEQATASPVYPSPRPQRHPPERRPIWLDVSDWLKRHRLGKLEPTWLLLVGLWRGPYASLLATLAVALSLNVAFIVYAVITPGGGMSLDALLGSSDAPATATGPVAPTFTPDHLVRTCRDEHIQIAQPRGGEIVPDTFQVFGTVSHPDMWSYTVEVGYLGQTDSLDAVPALWDVVRGPPPNQSIPEPPIIDDALTSDPVDLTGGPPGFYALRLRVMSRYGQELPTCDVVVRR